MRTIRSTGLAAIAALALAAPAAARADQQHHGGVTIDAHGVHLQIGSGVHYAYVSWPHAYYSSFDRHHRYGHPRYGHPRYGNRHVRHHGYDHHRRGHHRRGHRRAGWHR